MEHGDQHREMGSPNLLQDWCSNRDFGSRDPVTLRGPQAVRVTCGGCPGPGRRIRPGQAGLGGRSCRLVRVTAGR
jgi:hypothetical protein